MKDKDEIKDLFSKELGQHQVSVRPELWNAIQAKLAVGSSAAASSALIGKSLLVKGIIGLSAASILGVSTYFILRDNSDAHKTLKTTENVVKIPRNNVKVPENESKLEKITQKSTKVVEPKINQTTLPDQTEITEKSNIASDNVIHQPEVIVANTSISQTIQQPTTPIVKQVEQPIAKTTPNQPPKAIINQQKVTENTVSNDGSTDIDNQGFVNQWSSTNVFTPNNDGVNDYFYLNTGQLKDFSISILDKNNQVVFRSDDVNFKWDGRSIKSGEIVPSGTYSYIVIAYDSNGKLVKRYETLYIAR